MLGGIWINGMFLDGPNGTIAEVPAALMPFA